MAASDPWDPDLQVLVITASSHLHRDSTAPVHDHDLEWNDERI